MRREIVTEEEIEAVAHELAKVGGLSWYPGRTKGALLRPVSERYRDRARVAIATLDRLRAQQDGKSAPQVVPADGLVHAGQRSAERAEDLQVGSVVVYRPPGEKRAISCRVERLEESRAYLVPCPRSDIGWVSLEDLSRTEADANRSDPAQG
jgi:hypothetical protein